uniref:Putative secreted protein n=1 Tax=Ixodes ricinus TaxID=34613 RepID=A0A6B0UB45_IXORI
MAALPRRTTSPSSWWPLWLPSPALPSPWFWSCCSEGSPPPRPRSPGTRRSPPTTTRRTRPTTEKNQRRRMETCKRDHGTRLYFFLRGL